MKSIGVGFLHDDVEKALVSRQIQILEGPWGHVIIVRLRRLTVIGHAHSLFFLFQRGVVPL